MRYCDELIHLSLLRHNVLKFSLPKIYLIENPNNRIKPQRSIPVYEVQRNARKHADGHGPAPQTTRLNAIWDIDDSYLNIQNNFNSLIFSF